jgi:CDGSH-type Zn-finger protein
MAGVKIEVRLNGPNRIQGPFDLVDQDGKAFKVPEGQWVSLCRCGASSNKPFCDGSHRTCGFDAPTKAG